MLLRHAKALADTGPTGAAGDHARDLSDRGCRDALAMGDTLRRRGLLPQHVLVSSALRTRRTLELLGGFDTSPGIEIVDRLYLAEPEELLACVQGLPDTMGAVMLVGHNPGLHELAMHLGGSGAPAGLRDGLPTCALVVLEIEGSWSSLPRHGGSPAELIRA